MGCKSSSDKKEEQRGWTNYIPVAQQFAPKEDTFTRNCTKDHKLARTDVDSRWGCNICGGIYAKGTTSYRCADCDYDVCTKCAVGATCEKSHVLTYARLDCDWGCDKCKASSSAYYPSHGCRTCNYDLCQKCYSRAKKEQEHKIAEENDVKIPAPVKPSDKPRTKCLFIGINYPGTSAALNGCVNDVLTMKQLIEDVGVSTDDRKVLVDLDDCPIRTGAPTKAEIEEGIKWLVSGAEKGDVLFFHYSGHGTRVRDQDGDEDDGYDEALVPGDYQSAGVIRDDWIFDNMIKDLPEGVRLTAVCDCCHSGTIFDLEFMWTWDDEKQRFSRPGRSGKRNAGGEEENVCQRAFTADSKNSTKADVLMISGCMDSQTSADTYAKFDHDYGEDNVGRAGGACTNSLAEVVKNGQEESGSAELEISYGELLLRLQQKLKEKRYTQIPQMTTSRHIDMDHYFTFTSLL